MSDEKKRAAAAAAPGAARARLAVFERQQKGKRALFMRVGILVVLILICLGVLAFLRPSLDDEWFDVSRDAAWCATRENWEGLERLIAADFRLDAPVELDRAALLQALKADSDPTFAVFATRPYEWKAHGDGVDVIFWVTASRGDLNKDSTVPLVRTWLVRARLEHRGEPWVFTRATAREALQQPR